jgi:hypothetical protein
MVDNERPTGAADVVIVNNKREEVRHVDGAERSTTRRGRQLCSYRLQTRTSRAGPH